MSDNPDVAAVLRDRCYAAVGTAWTGPLYCGHPAKTTDANGRPVCGVHRRGQPGVEWLGARYRYPHGIIGAWRFFNGKPRP